MLACSSCRCVAVAASLTFRYRFALELPPIYGWPASNHHRPGNRALIVLGCGVFLFAIMLSKLESFPFSFAET